MANFKERIVATDDGEVVEYIRADLAPQWQPIETAPKDGTTIDVWCVPPDDVDFEPMDGGIRLTDVAWREPDEFFPHKGWIRIMDDGNWDVVDGEQTTPLGLPAWIPTHWIPKPTGPTQ